MLKKLIIPSLILSVFSCKAQETSRFAEDQNYLGGICMDGAICGTWVIKPDSTFVFFQIENKIIKKLGKGMVIGVENNVYKFRFINSLPILSSSQVSYFSQTKNSFDSIYIQGSIKNTNDQPIDLASIIFKNDLGTFSNGSGCFYSVFPRQSGINKLRIIKEISGYVQVEASLNPNNNYHELNIIIPFKDSLNASLAFSELMNDVEYSFRIIDKRNKKSPYLSLYPVAKSKQEIVSELKNAIKDQEYLIANINELIALIQK